MENPNVFELIELKEKLQLATTALDDVLTVRPKELEAMKDMVRRVLEQIVGMDHPSFH